MALRFMEKAIEAYKGSEASQRAQRKGVWLEVSSENTPAIKTYINYGFEAVTKPDNEGKIIMILEE